MLTQKHSEDNEGLSANRFQEVLAYIKDHSLSFTGDFKMNYCLALCSLVLFNSIKIKFIESDLVRSILNALNFDDVDVNEKTLVGTTKSMDVLEYTIQKLTLLLRRKSLIPTTISLIARISWAIVVLAFSFPSIVNITIKLLEELINHQENLRGFSNGCEWDYQTRLCSEDVEFEKTVTLYFGFLLFHSTNFRMTDFWINALVRFENLLLIRNKDFDLGWYLIGRGFSFLFI